MPLHARRASKNAETSQPHDSRPSSRRKNIVISISAVVIKHCARPIANIVSKSLAIPPISPPPSCELVNEVTLNPKKEGLGGVVVGSGREAAEHPPDVAQQRGVRGGSGHPKP